MLYNRDGTMKRQNDIVYLYHVGEQKPQPHPCKHEDGMLPKDLDRGVFTRESTEPYTWYRSWLPGKKAKAGVFLTPDPYQLAYYDCIRGKSYQYEVPRWVVKACGGIHRAARIHEVLILPEFWPYCKLVSSKPLDKTKLNKIKDGEWRRGANTPSSYDKSHKVSTEDAMKTLKTKKVERNREKRHKRYLDKRK